MQRKHMTGSKRIKRSRPRAVESDLSHRNGNYESYLSDHIDLSFVVQKEDEASGLIGFDSQRPEYYTPWHYWLAEQMMKHGCIFNGDSISVEEMQRWRADGAQDYLAMSRAIDECCNAFIPPRLLFEATKLDLTQIGEVTTASAALFSHIVSVRTEYVLRLARPLLNHLMVHPRNLNVFNSPVDYEALGLATYLQVVKFPMDLGTVQSRLRRRYYKSITKFVEDVQLVFLNAMNFNPPTHDVHLMAKDLMDQLGLVLSHVLQKCIRERKRKVTHNCQLCNGARCYICGEVCMRHEPPILTCQRAGCGQRIRKNSQYFVAKENGMRWCNKCYISLPASFNLIVCSVGNSSVDESAQLKADRQKSVVVCKKSLLKRRVDQEVPESWVCCVGCGMWCHQICVLYSAIEIEKHRPFFCTFCMIAIYQFHNSIVSSDTSTINGVVNHASIELSNAPQRQSELPNKSNVKLCEQNEEYSINTLELSHHKVSVCKPSVSNIASGKGVEESWAELKLNSCNNFDKLQDTISETKVANTKAGIMLKSLNDHMDSGDHSYYPSSAIHSVEIEDDATTTDSAEEFRLQNFAFPGPYVTSIPPAVVLDTVDTSVDFLIDQNGIKGSAEIVSALNTKSGALERCEIHGAIALPTKIARSKTARRSNGRLFNRCDVVDSLVMIQSQRVTNASPITAAVRVRVEGDNIPKLDQRRHCNREFEQLERECLESNVPTEFCDSLALSTANNVRIKEYSDHSSSSIVVESGDDDRKPKCDNIVSHNLGYAVASLSGHAHTDSNIQSESQMSSIFRADSDAASGDNLSGDIRIGNRVEECDKHSPSAAFPLPPYERGSASSLLDVISASGEHRWHWYADSLPRTLAGDFLEALIRGLLVDNGYGQEVASSISVRMVSNRDMSMEVQTHIVDNLCTYDGFKLPDQIGFRQKCFLLFQRIDGVDVCLFCLYVQEFNALCPPPNSSSVYIAYLDSVDYFRPMEARSMVYQELVGGYLQWARMRGFARAHIWSCPPQRGDNFIFYAHPPHQRTPSRDRLNAWYKMIISRCMRAGVVQEMSNVWHKYFLHYVQKERMQHCNPSRSLNRSVDAAPIAVKRKVGRPRKRPRNEQNNFIKSELHNDFIHVVCPPVFEGDYWVQEYLKQCCAFTHRTEAHYRSTALNSGNIDAGTKKEELFYLRRCKVIIQNLIRRDALKIFTSPVDPQALNVPNYFDVITHPMDYGTIREKLRSGSYNTVLDFVKDVRLVFDNARTFNPVGHYIHEYAESSQALFNQLVHELKKVISLHSMTADALPPNQNIESLNSEISDSILQTIKISSSRTEVDKGRKIGEGYNWSTSHHQTNSLEVMPDAIEDALVGSFDEINGHHHEGNAEVTGVNLEEESPNCNQLCDGGVRAPPQFAQIHPKEEESFQSDPSGERIVSEYYRREMEFNADELNLDYKKVPFRSQGEQSPASTSSIPASDVLCIFSDVGKGVQRIQDDLMVINLTPYNCRDFQQSRRAAANDILCETSAQGTTTQKSSALIPSIRRATVSYKRQPTEVLGGLLNMPVECLEIFSRLSTQERSAEADPDSVVCSPLADSRHTFLEMCQYRNYQFDSLRRAKHSSMMILYHLHHPYDLGCRPTCARCRNSIRNLRWHCDKCPNFDLCSQCYREDLGNRCADGLKVAVETESERNRNDRDKNGIQNAYHPHELTPFRVTFV